MKIVAVDPQARVPSEQEILALLQESILIRLGVFRIAAGRTPHKANLLRANPRASIPITSFSSSP